MLILDGFDETHGWSEDKIGHCKVLAGFSNVIITSRSIKQEVSSKLGVDIDLELEATGFGKETILAYLKNQEVVPKAVASEINSYIDNTPSVLELVRLPIHLEFLCYS